MSQTGTTKRPDVAQGVLSVLGLDDYREVASHSTADQCYVMENVGHCSLEFHITLTHLSLSLSLKS